MSPIIVQSSLDNTKQRIATLQLGIPTRFAQVYVDSADGAMSFYLAHPNGQTLKKATSNNYSGSSMAVVEMPNGNFVYAWSKWRCLDSPCNISISDIEYTILDRFGSTVREVSKVTNNSSATISTSDWSPAVAVAPNGNIGVLWVRNLHNSNTNQDNSNVYFAILDASGNVVQSPTNLTNNTTWGSWENFNMLSFSSPQVVATGDNRFILAWGQFQMGSGFSSNVWYVVRDTNGDSIMGVTQLTNDNNSTFRSANSAAGNAALLTWARGGDTWYAVLNSSGTPVKTETNLSANGQGSYSSADSVTLSDGKTVVVWNYRATYYSKPQLSYAILDETYNRTVGPALLYNPYTDSGDYDVSVATDTAGRAVVTWRDYSSWRASSYLSRLFYALVGSNGSVLTQPMIFRTSQAATPLITTSYAGYGNTSYSSSLPVGVDNWIQVGNAVAPWTGTASLGSQRQLGNIARPSAGTSSIPIQRGNHGLTTATSVVLTTTLPVGLTYNSDTSGSTPSVNGTTVTWNLPDMGFLSDSEFNLIVNVPNAPLGTRYTVNVGLSAAGASTKTASGDVVVSSLLYLPLILR